ncbi:MAG: tetratricopeptide repeat protein, partial [Bdellovibrionales bacterium]|nr:tetratricopeptide repeat protein [Bdellovibrionales bacterium]
MNIDFSKNLTVDELLGQIDSETLIGSKSSLTQNEERPSSSDIQELRASAELLISAGDYALARNILLAMIQNGELVGWALRSMGRTYEIEGNIERARRCFQDAIAYEPHLDAYRCLASLEIRSKNDAAAADALERSLNIRNLDPKVRFEIHKASGNCWMRAQRFEKSEHHYKRALAIDPTSDQIS